MTKPLADIRVLDLALLLPGALTATWLADLGATVTRIEPPWGNGFIGWRGQDLSPYFSVLRSGKQLLNLNFRRPEERERLLDLVKESDILIEGYRPGMLDRRGLGYEVLAEINPGLIYCSISAFGQTGEERAVSGHDINFLALAGILDGAGNGNPENPPRLPPFQLADVGGGSYPALVAIMTALFVRERTGRGQHLDVSLYDGTHTWNYFNLPLAAHMTENGTEAINGLLTGRALCYNVYECADGKWLAVGALEPFVWRNLCELLERPDLVSLAANPEPGAKERLASFRDLFRSRPRDEWLALLAQKETFVSPLLTFDEVLQDERLRERALLADGEPYPRPRFPVRITGAPE